MAQTYGYTSPDDLPYPVDLQAAADVPTIVTALANAAQAALSARTPTTRSVVAGSGLSGGGSLSVDRTLSVDTNTIATRSYVDSRIWTGTQAQYNAIGTKDPTVVYIITG